MDDNLRRRRSAGRVDAEGLDSSRSLEPEPESISNALGQPGQTEIEGARDPMLFLDEKTTSVQEGEGRRGASWDAISLLRKS